jgi:hypothetical protein
MTSNSPENLDLHKKKDKLPISPSTYTEPSHIMTGDYAAFMETNGKEFESWYYFIRREGNEDALKHLQDQLEKIDWFILDDLSTFDLDLDHSVSASTAKQMTKLELNSYAFHRKFDGKLKQINFNFRKKDTKDNERSNERMIGKVFDLLGYGQIEDYISDEDLDLEDLTDNETSSESKSNQDTEDDSDSTSETESKLKNDKNTAKPVTNKGIPPSLLKGNLPRFAKGKRR